MKKYSWLKYSISGAAAGIINGFFGAGGGMLLVPMLIKFCKIDDKFAFPTAIAIILPISLVSLGVHYTEGVFPVIQALPYLIGGLIGGIVGGLIFKKTSTAFLHKLFGAIIIWGGLRLLWN